MKLAVADFLAPRRLGELDAASGHLHGLSSSTAPPPVRGVYALLGDTTVVFYGDGGALHLRAGDAVVSLAGASVELKGEQLRTLRVSRGGEELFRLQYPNPIHPPLELDPTMAEEEDFDLGVFVRNVASSGERTTHQLERWSA